MSRGAASPWARTLGLLLALVALRLVALRDPALVERDAEEGFSAAQGWMMRQGHLRDAFYLQYRQYCGGCTVQASLAAGLSLFLPLSWLSFKLLPIGAWGLALACGQRWLHRVVSPRAGLVFGALMLIPPRAPLSLSATGWANHMEAGCLAVALLAARGSGPGLGLPRAALIGLLGGLALYTSFSGAFVAVGALLCLGAAARREGPRAWVGALGLLLAPLGWGLQRGLSGNQPLHVIYAEDEWVPRLSRLPAKLASLAAPNQLVALIGDPLSGDDPVPLGLLGALGLLVAAAAALAGPRHLRLPVILAAIWLGMYCLSGFSVRTPAPPELSHPGGLRYAAAVMPLSAVILASAARARVGVLLALAPLVAGGLALRPALQIVQDDVHSIVYGEERPGRAPGRADPWAEAADWAYVRAQLSYALPLERHRACRSADPRCREVHAYAEGREAATAALRADPTGGCGVPLPPARRSPVEAEGVGEAVAQQLAAHLDSGALATGALLPALDACLNSLWGGDPVPEAAARAALAPLLQHPSQPLGAAPAARLSAAGGAGLRGAPPALAAPLAYALGLGCAPEPSCMPGPGLPDAVRAAALDGVAAGLSGALPPGDPRGAGPDAAALHAALAAVRAARRPAAPAWWPGG